jgi:hypothetical protein
VSAECSKQLDKLTRHSGASAPIAGEGPTHYRHNGKVKSRFGIVIDLPALYNPIYEGFPGAYNSNNYRFGLSTIVKMYDPVKREMVKDKTAYVATQPTTHYLTARSITVIQTA